MSKRSDKHSRDLEKQSAEIKKLRRRLKNADESAAEWKAKAKRFEADAKEADAKAERSAAKAAKRHKLVKKLREDLRSHSNAPEATAGPAPASTGSAQPDESWTVTRLRATAREASLPRYSRMTKAELVDALTRPTGL